jgi:hypothetical protein
VELAASHLHTPYTHRSPSGKPLLSAVPPPHPFQSDPTHCSRLQQPGVTRRALLCLGAAAWGLPSRAAGFPSRPIELIVPWPAGGATDLTLRILCDEAAPLLGQPLVVINRPGAAGTQVAPLLKAATPDGHTIGQVPITVYRHALMNAVPWNPVTDLSPIVQVSGTTFGVLVPMASPFQRFGELIDWARTHPGRLIVGSTGVGATTHLAMEEVLQQHGIRYVHVPYRGTADQMLDVASGQVMVGVNSTLSEARAGPTCPRCASWAIRSRCTARLGAWPRRPAPPKPRCRRCTTPFSRPCTASAMCVSSHATIKRWTT